MGITIIFIILFVIGLALLGWLFWCKWDQLRLLDPNTLPDAQTRQLKHEILRQRVHRMGNKYVKRAKKSVLTPFGKKLQEGVRRVAGKLTAAERSYQKKQREAGGERVNREAMRTMLQEAKKACEKSEWDRAEKILIEIISANPRQAEAYERLGRLYFQRKEYDLARETWQFLNKLTPKDPSVLTALGEVEQRRGELEQAKTYFDQAVKLRPNNPKYLDLYITLLIELEDVHESNQYLDRLREVNPENKKIEEFERRIEEVRKKRADG